MTTPAVVPSLPVADRLAPPTPADPKDVMARGKKVAAALRRFVKAHPEQVVQIDGNSHPRAEAWQFVAACYGHSAIVASTEELLEREMSAGFIAIAHLRDPGGQIVSGAEAVCMRSENKWREAESFQLRSMAQTRACAKVTRNVFAWVMVLAGFSPTPAEELENRAAFDEIKSAPAPRAKVAEKPVTQKQIRAFNQACAATGKSADEVSGYLLTTHKATTIEELKRGKPFTEALRWAETRSTLEIVRPGPQPAQKMLDLMPKHKDAYSL